MPAAFKVRAFGGVGGGWSRLGGGSKIGGAGEEGIATRSSCRGSFDEGEVYREHLPTGLR